MGSRGMEGVAAFAVFALFVAAHVAAAVWFFHAYPESRSWSELLVNYQGGFVKRGLLGEIAFRLRDAVPPRQLLTGIVFTAYGLVTALLVAALGLHRKFPDLRAATSTCC